MPICLFGLDATNFNYGYVAGFGSQSFADKCWTSKEGPHPFEECKEVWIYMYFMIISKPLFALVLVLHKCCIKQIQEKVSKP